MTEKPTITYAHIAQGIKDTKNKIEINEIRYRDVQRRLEDAKTSMSRRADLVIKEQALDLEIQKLTDNLSILLDAYKQGLEKGANATDEVPS